MIPIRHLIHHKRTMLQFQILALLLGLSIGVRSYAGLPVTADLEWREMSYYAFWMEFHEVLVGPADSTDPTDGSWSPLLTSDLTYSVWYNVGPMTLEVPVAGVRLAFHYEGQAADEWMLDDLCVSAQAPCDVFHEDFNSLESDELPPGWFVVEGPRNGSGKTWGGFSDPSEDSDMEIRLAADDHNNLHKYLVTDVIEWETNWDGPVPPDTQCNLRTFDGSEYWFCINARSFKSARSNCRAVGMDLAVIDSQSENDFVRGNISYNSFFGLTDAEIEGTWESTADEKTRWCGDASGSVPGGLYYEKWRAGFPVQSTNRNCALIRSWDGKWKNIDCDNQKAYVCETKPEAADLDDLAFVRENYRTGDHHLGYLEFNGASDIGNEELFIEFEKRFQLRGCVDTLEQSGGPKIIQTTNTANHKLVQKYKGTDVLSGGYIVQRDVETGRIVAAIGKIEHGIDVDVDPSISGSAAFETAIAFLGGDPSEYTPPPAGDLYVVPARVAPNMDWRLAWVFVVPQTSTLDGFTIGVDAHSGEIVLLVNARRYACPSTILDKAQTAPRAALNIQCAQQSIWGEPALATAVQTGGVDNPYVLYSRGLDPVIDMNTATLLEDTPVFVAMCDEVSNDPADVPMLTALESDFMSVDVESDESQIVASYFMAAQRCIEFLASDKGVKNTLGQPWVGMDGIGYQHFVLARDNITPFGSISWNAGTIEYSLPFDPLDPEAVPFFGASTEILCHEIAHDIWVGSTGRLGFPIAASLNEGFADIMGTAAEMFVRGYRPGEAWCFGGDGWSNTTCLRNLEDPYQSWHGVNGQCPKDYMGPLYSTSPIECSNLVTEDCYDPHCNGTVLGHWFYLLTEGDASTNETGCPFNVVPLDAVIETSVNKALQILFNAVTRELATITPDLDSDVEFEHLSEATILSAERLYGPGSTEVQSVVAAWYAVNVRESYYEEVDAINKPQRNADRIDPWVSFKWPAYGDETAWDFQLAMDDPTNTIYEESNITDSVSMTGKRYGKLDLALRPAADATYFWRVRPHEEPWTPWLECYPIHWFNGTSELPKIENIEIYEATEGIVPPTTMTVHWDGVSAATSYRVIFSRTEGDCDDPGDLLDIDEEFTLEDLELCTSEVGHTGDRVCAWLRGVYPEEEYWMHIQALGPKDMDGNTAKGHCSTMKFVTDVMSPPSIRFPKREILFEYGNQYAELDGSRTLYWHWTQDNYVPEGESVVTFFERTAGGDCTDNVVGGFRQDISLCSPSICTEEGGVHEPNPDSSAALGPDPRGYCWNVKLVAANGSESAHSTKEEWGYYIAPVVRYSPGVPMHLASSNNLSGAIYGDSWGDDVTYEWAPSPWAHSYVVNHTEYRYLWPLETGTEPPNCIDGCVDWSTGPGPYVVDSSGTALPIDGETAGKGRYCWDVYPKIVDREDPTQEAGFQPPLRTGAPLCYTTGPSSLELTFDEPGSDGMYEPGRLISGDIKYEYVPDMQIEIVWPPIGDVVIQSACTAGEEPGDYFDSYDCWLQFYLDNIQEGRSYNIAIKRWNDDYEFEDITAKVKTRLCGDFGERCCREGEECDRVALICNDDDICVDCGDPDEPCCENRSPCNSWNRCIGNTCEPCGLESGDPCCYEEGNGYFCSSSRGLSCISGTCQNACDAAGAECGTVDGENCGSCGTWQNCVSRQCKSCGDVGQDCCDSGDACRSDNYYCDGSKCQRKPADLSINQCSPPTVTNIGGTSIGEFYVTHTSNECWYDIGWGSGQFVFKCPGLAPGGSVDIETCASHSESLCIPKLGSLDMVFVNFSYDAVNGTQPGCCEENWDNNTLACAW